jgi:hypothetical protein
LVGEEGFVPPPFHQVSDPDRLQQERQHGTQ